MGEDRQKSQTRTSCQVSSEVAGDITGEEVWTGRSPQPWAEATHEASQREQNASQLWGTRDPASVILFKKGGRTDKGTELSPESLNLPAQPPQQDQTPSDEGWRLQPHHRQGRGHTGPRNNQGLSLKRGQPAHMSASPHPRSHVHHTTWGGRYLGVLPPFLGVVGFLLCQRWPWMVKASTLMDMVLAGICVNRLRSELYL